MDLTQLTINQTLGTIAFLAGVVLLLIELFRNGLSKISIFSYGCFVLSSILLSSDIWLCIVAIAGLTVLFGILLKFYRREVRRRTKNATEKNEVEK